MAENVSQQLARVTVKSQMLLERYRSLRTSYEQSLDRIAELEQELRRRRDTIEELKRELSYTKAAATISASSPEDVAHTKVMLAEILREIDTCISRLTY